MINPNVAELIFPGSDTESTLAQRIAARILFTLEKEVNSVLDLKEYITNNLDIFLEAIELFKNAQRVVITGMGKSGMVGDLVRETLISTGTPHAVYTNAAETAHGSLALIEEGTVLLAYSHSGESNDLTVPIKRAIELGIPIVAVTGKVNSTLAKYSKIFFDDSVKIEACKYNLAPTSSLVNALIISHCLAMGSSEAVDFTADDFRYGHPGGSLGDRLKPAKDVMHKNVAIFDESDCMVDVLLKTSQGHVGTALCLDDSQQIRGILTDGDIRRLKENNLNGSFDNLKPVDEMTTSPKLVIDEDMFLEDVEKHLKAYQVNAAPVINKDNQVVGIIHINQV